jgi:ubiquinone/menaquinone biosynthesis C-methylase UbiE
MSKKMIKNLTKKQQSFAKKMVDILNYGSLNLAMAIGYKTGLFEIMDEFKIPKQLSCIAKKSGLNKRYIREWLGIMVTGNIIEISSDSSNNNLFYLPEEHGDFLTKRSANNNLGVYTQEIPLLTTCSMDAVIERFKTGKGVPYTKYPKFQDFMAELADAKHREVLIDKFIPNVDKGKLSKRLKEGINVCDLGCGQGTAILLMAKTFKKSHFIGIDISQSAIKRAIKNAKLQNIKNVEFLLKDASTLKDNNCFKNRFDYITAFDAIHDQTQPLSALKSVFHMLSFDGIFSMVDIAADSDLAKNIEHPMGPFLYTVSLMHCMPVGMVDNGSGQGMMWGKQKVYAMLTQAGFINIKVEAIADDTFNFHYICKKQ